MADTSVNSSRVHQRVKAVISVASGEVWATSRRIVLRSDGIGSCVVIAAYDIQKRIGALAHVMLPGESLSDGYSYNTKYARDAVKDMLFKMGRLGTVKGRIEACLVGGGNVLMDEDDTVCEALIGSVTGILDEEGIKVMRKAVGGTTRRWAILDIEDGALYYAEGDGGMKLLYYWRPDYGK